jgi:signal transduction histidine kinase
MAIVEGTGHIVRHVNHAFCHLMAKPAEQLVGRSFGDLLPEKGQCVALLDRVSRTGQPETCSDQESAEPHPPYWSYTMWPVMADEHPVGIMVQMSETGPFQVETVAITESLVLGLVRQHELTEAADGSNARLVAEIAGRRRAQQELVAARNEISHYARRLEAMVAERTGELRESIHELEAFSYSVSHDMRAPLRAMQSYAQYLVDEYGGKLDEQGVNYLQQIMRSAVRLDHLIQDVLSYTRIIHSPVPMEPVELDRLVRDIVETYPNGQPIQPRISIRGTLPRVMGNEALLTQCVSNLLNNGAKFVSPGVTPRLEISAEVREESMVRVWFADNGIGIAAKDHERVFRLLERIHPAAEYEGTGIGLTIVRKAVERMGAQVGFDSALGQGSRFWIQLKKG